MCCNFKDYMPLMNYCGLEDLEEQVSKGFQAIRSSTEVYQVQHF